MAKSPARPEGLPATTVAPDTAAGPKSRTPALTRNSSTGLLRTGRGAATSCATPRLGRRATPSTVASSHEEGIEYCIWANPALARKLRREFKLVAQHDSATRLSFSLSLFLSFSVHSS